MEQGSQAFGDKHVYYMYACMYACDMCVCMYVFMYVCMYVSTCCFCIVQGQHVSRGFGTPVSNARTITVNARTSHVFSIDLS